VSATYHITEGDDLAGQAAQSIAEVLKQALAVRDTVSLMVSGGSSPKPLYRQLSETELDWSRVHISLVDERWVEPGEVGSNEDFIRENLIRDKAANARFFGLKTKGDDPKAGLAEAEARFSTVVQPFDVVVMGMGTDAHTASWFPHAQGLETALASDNAQSLCAIKAHRSEVTGDHLDRITLTAQAVLSAHHIVLFMPGAAKRAVFDAARNKAVEDAPVKTLLAAGSKLHVYASPAS